MNQGFLRRLGAVFFFCLLALSRRRDDKEGPPNREPATSSTNAGQKVTDAIESAAVPAEKGRPVLGTGFVNIVGRSFTYR